MILALRALGLGDLLTGVPALRALRRHRPGEELVLAAPAPLAPLVRRIAAVDRMHPVPSAAAGPPGRLPWTGPPPDLAVNLHGKGPQSTDALRRLGTGELWSYRVPGGPGWSDEEHDTVRWCRLLTAYGCPADPADLYLTAEPRQGDAAHRTVLVHPGAATPQRRWPAERYAAVARALAEGASVHVTAGPAEEALAREVVRIAGLPAGAVLAGLDLAALADLVHESTLVVCGDTGVAHLATAYRTPSVVLFGPQPPDRWGPPADGPHRVLWRPAPGDGDARPDAVHPALLRVTPADVLAAAGRSSGAAGPR